MDETMSQETLLRVLRTCCLCASLVSRACSVVDRRRRAVATITMRLKLSRKDTKTTNIGATKTSPSKICTFNFPFLSNFRYTHVIAELLNGDLVRGVAEALDVSDPRHGVREVQDGRDGQQEERGEQRRGAVLIELSNLSCSDARAKGARVVSFGDF